MLVSSELRLSKAICMHARFAGTSKEPKWIMPFMAQRESQGLDILEAHLRLLNGTSLTAGCRATSVGCTDCLSKVPLGFWNVCTSFATSEEYQPAVLARGRAWTWL